MIQSWDGQGTAKFVILEIIWRTFLHVYLAYGAHFRFTDYEASAPPRATLLLLAPGRLISRIRRISEHV